MKPRNKELIVFIALILMTTLACNISIEGAAPQGPSDIELTITAQAFILQQPGQTSAPAVIAESPTATSASPSEATPTTGGSGIIAASTTSVSSTVTVTVSVETNCRTGPSVNFASKYSLPAGQVAEVIGKNTLTNYWIIKIPGSGSGSTCWLWGKYATVSGNVSGLAEVATPIPPSTATSTFTSVPILQAPAAPSNLSQQNTCTVNPNPEGFTYLTAGTVSWQDNSNNETGFNIYWRADFSGARDLLLGSVGPNTTSYAFGGINTYSDMANSIVVEAFNNVGASQRVSVIIVLSCPP